MEKYEKKHKSMKTIHYVFKLAVKHSNWFWVSLYLYLWFVLILIHFILTKKFPVKCSLKHTIAFKSIWTIFKIFKWFEEVCETIMSLLTLKNNYYVKLVEIVKFLEVPVAHIIPLIWLFFLGFLQFVDLLDIQVQLLRFQTPGNKTIWYKLCLSWTPYSNQL